MGPHTEQNRMVWYGMVQDRTGQGGPPIQNRIGWYDMVWYGTVQDRTGQDRGLRHWTDDEMQSVAVCSAYAEDDVKRSQQ